MTVTSASDVQPDLRAIADHQEITDLVDLLGLALDEGNPDDVRQLLVEDASVHTPGGEASGRDAVAAQAVRNHPDDQRFQHVTSNVLVQVTGDRATARANLVVHITMVDAPPVIRSGRPLPPPLRASIGEVYRFDLVRTADGWRFSRIEALPRWLDGDLPPAPA
jgi:hypothetical protein